MWSVTFAVAGSRTMRAEVARARAVPEGRIAARKASHFVQVEATVASAEVNLHWRSSQVSRSATISGGFAASFHSGSSRGK